MCQNGEDNEVIRFISYSLKRIKLSLTFRFIVRCIQIDFHQYFILFEQSNQQ